MILMRISSAPVEQVEPYGSKEILDFADLKASPRPPTPRLLSVKPRSLKAGAFSLCIASLLAPCCAASIG